MGRGTIYNQVLLLLTLLLPVSAECQESAFRLEKLPFNSPLSNEMAPVIVQNGIIFCSDRKINSFSDGKSFAGERLYNLYIVEQADTAKWKNLRRLKGAGSKLAFYGPVSIAADGKTVWFTSAVLSGKQAKKRKVKSNPMGIYSGNISGSVITNIQPLKFNSRQYNIANPSISRDGKYLFFSSNMPGSLGKSDIYYCENVNGEWKDPVNLGPTVNSKESENYPFMHASGKLYFSSDRPTTIKYMGGIDVYYTAMVNGKWESPVPMGEPINSKSDDFAFVAVENLETGYFTRSDGRSDDLYRYKSLIIRKTECGESEEESFCYEFFEENALKFDTIPFKYKWNFGDGSTGEGIKTVHCFKEAGTYRVSIDVTNLVTNKTQKEEKVYLLEVTRAEQPYITSADECRVGEEIKLSAEKTYLPGWNIARYYWNFDDMSIAVGRDVSKKYMQAGSYTVQLIVTSAPDETGVVREACVSKNITVGRRP